MILYTCIGMATTSAAVQAVQRAESVRGHQRATEGEVGPRGAIGHPDYGLAARDGWAAPVRGCFNRPDGWSEE